MHDVLYEKQDSPGKLSWTDLARRAGLADSVGLKACIADSVIASRVKQDEVDGRKLGRRGTPLVS
jgi:protein-disulfide isomerase